MSRSVPSMRPVLEKLRRADSLRALAAEYRAKLPGLRQAAKQAQIDLEAAEAAVIACPREAAQLVSEADAEVDRANRG